MKNTITTLLLSALFLIPGVAGAQQVSLDMESGDRNADAANCWVFDDIGYVSNPTINGGWSARTVKLTGGVSDPAGIESPWITFGVGQSISFGHRLVDGNWTGTQWKKMYVLSLAVQDSGTSNYDTLYTYNYNSGNYQNNVWPNINLPFSYSTQVRKVFFMFAGEGGDERGLIDDIYIGGTYNSDPSNNCAPNVSYTDTDGDGIADDYDQYPADQYRAFRFSFPSDETHGTLMFEDLWPSRGDYDFNDLVINYNVAIVMNSDGNLVEMKFNMVTRAWGASNKNGVGIQFDDFNPDKIYEVTGYKNYSGSPFVLNANGTEAGQSSANVVFISDVTKALKHPGGGIGVNVTDTAPTVPYDTTVILVKFMNEGVAAPGGTVSMSDFDGDILNPYIIINQDRTREVHLPDHKPTDKANLSLLGTGNDDSNPSLGKYYKTKDNLPWALAVDNGNIPYMKEKQEITTGYLKLINWVTSDGNEYWDWWDDQPGYRDASKLY